MMLEDVVYQNYGLVMERQETKGPYRQFFSGDALFTIVPIDELEEQELVERLRMSEFMQQQGDHFVSSFVMSNEQTYLSEVDETLFVLLANYHLQEPRDYKMGSKLAKFHHRARQYPDQVTACNRIGQWKGLWEERLDAVERAWREKLHAHPSNEFETLFVESFPYYLALGENAIQYLVDSELDDEPSPWDAGTICHDRFYTDTWSGDYLVKNPFDWVFDHHSRDLGEWVRENFHRYPQTYQPSMVQFLQEYQQGLPLSGFSWRLLYARLLFPVHYLECVENYFSGGTESNQRKREETLEKCLEQSHYYEDFLKQFHELNGVPLTHLKIPRVDWL
ncbi:spore coat putative kinase YutH [Bacillus testis]|uniref:spore coat putative kinase YutH n=1 Tax=Bacillus testis TaxID=1622072 RepID=UPI00067F47FF|nr:spore coat protein YutH [Bacillus testis]